MTKKPLIGERTVLLMMILGLAIGQLAAVSDMTLGGALTTGGDITAGDQFVMQDGSVSAPALIYSSETNTGWYTTGSTMRLAIDGGLAWSVTGANMVVDPGHGIIAEGITADQVDGSCTAGRFRFDNAGATREWCFCPTTNVVYCVDMKLNTTD